MIGAGVVLLAYAYWRLGHFTLYVGFWRFLPILVMSGIGMGASMVTLSTVSLSTIPRHAMTVASSLYTLTRREAGNVAYAALATPVARREQFIAQTCSIPSRRPTPRTAELMRCFATPC